MKKAYFIFLFSLFFICNGCSNDSTITEATHNGNFAPNKPNNPTPHDSLVSSPGTHIEFSWSGGDPGAGDTVHYDLYFDTVNPPQTKIAQSSLSTFYDLGIPASGIYFWQVKAKEETGLTTDGPVWRFTITP